MQVQLTIADLVAEVHETHHPIAAHLYYEDQRPAAKKRAEAFVRRASRSFSAGSRQRSRRTTVTT